MGYSLGMEVMFKWAILKLFRVSKLFLFACVAFRIEGDPLIFIQCNPKFVIATYRFIYLKMTMHNFNVHFSTLIGNGSALHKVKILFFKSTTIILSSSTMFLLL